MSNKRQADLEQPWEETCSLTGNPEPCSPDCTMLQDDQGPPEPPTEEEIEEMAGVGRREFWHCNVCGAQNHETDGECGYCECGGVECQRDNCSGPNHPGLDEPQEPEEGDITTGDHCHFYQDGKLVLVIDEEADHIAELRAYMERTKFWPNVWFISDHGNAHLMEIDQKAVRR